MTQVRRKSMIRIRTLIFWRPEYFECQIHRADVHFLGTLRRGPLPPTSRAPIIHAKFGDFQQILRNKSSLIPLLRNTPPGRIVSKTLP